ncbi:MAG TPA: adenylate/guanylate cyclase domain-containing protein, partial [Nitrospirales bacterium]
IVFVGALLLHLSGLFEIAELKTLDYRFQHYANPTAASPDIVLIAIDEASLETFGRWPWPRDRHGFMVQYLKQAGARAIIFDVLFLEPDEAAEEFDAAFAEQVEAAGNVFLPYQLQAEPSKPPPASLLAKLTLATVPARSRSPVIIPQNYQGLKLPIPPLAEAARGLGFITLTADVDGTNRRIPPLAQTSTSQLPVMHLTTSVARYVKGSTAPATLGAHALSLPPVVIPLTEEGYLLLNWHGSLAQKVYPAYSAGAVLKAYTELQKGQAPSLEPASFRDKIVFIAGTAAGTYDLRVTPLEAATPGVLIHMTGLDNILTGDFMRRAPYWFFLATTLVLCLATAWSFMLLRQQILKFMVMPALAIAYYGLAVHAFKSHGLWLELAHPEGAIAFTFALAASVEYLTEGRQRRQLRAAFDKYMAPEVVDEIMRHPEIKLGGERKELSILFSDIAGFTTISERLRPEELVELLNEYLSAMTDIIRRQRGNVNKYLGDGIMAIFGAPLGEPTHATLACYAALDSQEALAKLRADWKARGLPEVAARIGINTGEVVVGNMGSQARLEYTVMGDHVNLASRLEGASKFYDTAILIGPRTYELAQSDIEAREVDLLRVKGKHEPVVVYELLARKGGVDPVRHQMVEAYARGLRSYKARQFEPAQRDFEAALKLDPLDGPSKVYLRRTKEFLATPPPVDWDGVYELHSK